jgi:hypothetical protein
LPVLPQPPSLTLTLKVTEPGSARAWATTLTDGPRFVMLDCRFKTQWVTPILAIDLEGFANYPDSTPANLEKIVSIIYGSSLTPDQSRQLVTSGCLGGHADAISP